MIYYSERIQRKSATSKDAKGETCQAWRKTWRGGLQGRLGRLPRHRETLQSQPAGPGETGHHTSVEATFLRSEEFSSSSFQSPEKEERRKRAEFVRDRT